MIKGKNKFFFILLIIIFTLISTTIDIFSNEFYINYFSKLSYTNFLSNNYQNFLFLFSIVSFYRTCEMVEITGNEDTFNIVFSPLLLYSQKLNFNDRINLLSFFEINFDFNILSSNKSRFFNQFNPDLIRIREIYFETEVNRNFYFIACYLQNLILNYHFENYNPPVIYRTPAYPLPNYNLPYFNFSNAHPYFAFFLGDRILPLYYSNSAHLFDIFLLIKINYNIERDFSFSLYLGTSNGEEGLDSNSSKQFFSKIIIRSGIFENLDIRDNSSSKNRLLNSILFNLDETYKLLHYFYLNFFFKNETFIELIERYIKNYSYKKFLDFITEENLKLSGFYLSIATSLGERGSVPAKVRNDQFSFYLEYLYISKKFSFNFAFETYLTLHGFTKDKINPYDPTYNNFISDQSNPSYKSFWNLYLYNYNDGFLLPDDLPNYNNMGTPFPGVGFFIYFSSVFNSCAKFFIIFSFYDSNIFADDLIIYQPKYKISIGITYKLNNNIFSNISFSFIKDKVFENYVQFYEAESRTDHFIANYDLFFALLFYF